MSQREALVTRAVCTRLLPSASASLSGAAFGVQRFLPLKHSQVIFIFLSLVSLVSRIRIRRQVQGHCLESHEQADAQFLAPQD